MACFQTTEFSLQSIAESGQTFTWHVLAPSNETSVQRWAIASGSHSCMAWQREGTLFLTQPDGSEPNAAQTRYWRHYFTLDLDYGRILGSLQLPEGAHQQAWGTRVLAQDWWDVAVSFVISQNSSIKRIQHTMDLLMERAHGQVPSPARLQRLLADEGICQQLKLGYRLPYLRQLANRCQSWHPSCLDEPRLPLDIQLHELQQLPGVGPKVANCICLFGLEYLQAVPRDTWIKKAERELSIQWDPRYGGIQQQYVFAWVRREHGRL
ncbi:MAG: DNA glycosylase [Atopobiaceae bacterium]